MSRRTDIVRFDGLRGRFATYHGDLHALRGITFPVVRHAITGVVGETGSGKSVAARCLLGLHDSNFSLDGGAVHFGDTELTDLTEAEWRRVRGRRIAMVFQDARAALNPVFSVGEQLSRVLREHDRMSKRAAWARAVEMLDRVRIPEAASRAKQYPHQFSGGMAQRVMIALALIQRPELIVLDEPTTGLDVTIQADILDLVVELVADEGLSALLITHDLGVVSGTCDYVAVMYAGQCIEYASARDIFTRPGHPYTRELLRASLSVEGVHHRSALPGAPDDEGDVRFYSIPGTVPDLTHPIAGCAFVDRCPSAEDRCRNIPPPVWVGEQRTSTCHLAQTVIAAVDVPA